MNAQKDRESKLRLDIRRRQEHLAMVLGSLLGSGRMIAGSIYSRRRRCGKPLCHCVGGQLHEDRVLAVRRSGRVVVRCLDPIGDAATEEAVVAWRLFRRRRHELAQACRSLLDGVDRLGRLRQVGAGGSP